MKDLTAVDKGWSHNGHWEGGGLGGWAGGADDAWANDPEKRDLRPLSGSATPQTTSPTHNDSTDVGVNSLSSKTTRDNILAVGDEITIDTHLEFPSESPVLRRRRSVTFGPSRAKIIEPRGSQDKQPDPINEIPTPSSFLRLLDAVQNKTCQELINVLESGASQDAEVVEKGLQECYNEVKKKIIATKRDTETESTSKAFDDLNAKRKVLNFYVNSTLLLEKALNLEHWGSFELRVLNSDVRFLDSTSRPTSAGLMVCGNIRVGSSLPSQGGKMEKLVSPVISS